MVFRIACCGRHRRIREPQWRVPPGSSDPSLYLLLLLLLPLDVSRRLGCRARPRWLVRSSASFARRRAFLIKGGVCSCAVAQVCSTRMCSAGNNLSAMSWCALSRHTNPCTQMHTETHTYENACMHDTIRHETTRYDASVHDTTRHETMRHDSKRSGPPTHNSVYHTQHMHSKELYTFPGERGREGRMSLTRQVQSKRRGEDRI